MNDEDSCQEDIEENNLILGVMKEFNQLKEYSKFKFTLLEDTDNRITEKFTKMVEAFEKIEFDCGKLDHRVDKL